MPPCQSAPVRVETACATRGSLVRHLHQLARWEGERVSEAEWAFSSINPPFLYQTAHDAERVMNRTLAFIENELVAAHREDTNGAPPVLDSGDLDNFRPIIVRLVHEIRISELVLRECLDVCDG